MKHQRYRRGTLVDAKNIVVGHKGTRQPIEGMIVVSHPSIDHPKLKVLAMVSRIDFSNYYLYVKAALYE